VGARGKCGRVRGPQPALFLRAFWAINERSDEGEGGHRHTLTPSPRAAITIKSAQRARSAIIHHIFLKTPGPSVFTRALGERRAIRRGGGGTQAHINPLPPDCDHHQNAIARAPHDQSYFLKGPMLGSGPQPRPPPHARQSPPAHVSMQRDIKLFI
jgi:hypothetical protein